jgi:hypothetical protein
VEDGKRGQRESRYESEKLAEETDRKMRCNYMDEKDSQEGSN